MKDHFKDVEDKEMIKMLENILNEILYTPHANFKIVELFAYSSILSDILNASEDSELDEYGNFISGSHLEQWTESLESCIMDKRYDDFLDMIKQELLREERYEVLSHLIKVELI